MSTPIEDQLRDYFTMVDRMQGTVEVPTAQLDTARPDLRLVEDEQTHDMEDVMLAPKKTQGPNRARNWTVTVGAAATVALAIGLIVVATRSDDDQAPADDPPATAPITGTEIDPPARDLGFPGSTIDGGRYTTELLGVGLDLTVEGNWAVTEASASSIALRQPASTDATDSSSARWIHLIRLGGWNTSAEAVDPAFRTTGSIAPADIDRWIEENDIVVLDRRDATVDGRPATVLDVQVDPAGASAPLDFPRDPASMFNESCGADTAPCIWYRSIPAASEPGGGPRPDPVMEASQTRRMWLVDVGAFEPILIEAVVPVGDEQWLDDVEATTIASLGVGEDGPPLAVG